jgi:GT2 family glycosyltransferase
MPQKADTPQKQVAVILLNWNTPVHTINCILSLQQYCDESLFDIIIVDNGSTDDSVADIRSRFPELKYIENHENLGFAEGNNRGLMYSIAKGYTYSLVMNTDTLVDEDIVRGLTLHLNGHLRAAAVQPAIYWMHDKGKLWNGKGGFNAFTGRTFSDTTLPDEKNKNYENAKWLTGCCVLLRNSVLSTCGFFNERFFLYYEDVELSYRIRFRGYELHYLPAYKMYHEAGASATVQKKEGVLSPIIHYYIIRNHLWFLRKYGWAIFYPVYVLYNGCYYSLVWTYFKVRRRNEKAHYVLKALKDGIFTPQRTIWPV